MKDGHNKDINKHKCLWLQKEVVKITLSPLIFLLYYWSEFNQTYTMII